MKKDLKIIDLFRHRTHIYSNTIPNVKQTKTFINLKSIDYTHIKS